MSWASKSGNDWLTKLDISEGISAGALTAIGSGPAGKSNSDWVTRTEVAAWVQMGPSWWTGPDWATKGGVTSNALNLPYSFTVYYLSPHANYECFASKSDACTHSPAASMTIYTASASISAGAVLYGYDGTNFYPRTWSTNGGTYFWLYDATGAKPFKMVDGGSGLTTSTVDITDTCSVPNYEYVMKGSGAAYGSCAAARAAITGGPTLFTNQASSPPWVADGAVLYTDAACTTPFNGGGSWYGLHPMSYSGEYACIISSSGVISSASNSC